MFLCGNSKYICDASFHHYLKIKYTFSIKYSATKSLYNSNAIC